MSRWLTIYEDDAPMIMAKYGDGEKERLAFSFEKVGNDHIDFFNACALLFDDMLREIDASNSYNGRVVCIESNYLDFEVGKIYLVNKGKTIGERGFAYPSSKMAKSIEDLNGENLKFIEIIE
jgi:hypothetical protein